MENNITKIENNISTIKWVPINSVKLWKDNPRKNDSAVPKLAKLIEKHGFKSPLIVWKKDRVIYKGNTSYKAAKKLGLAKIPVAFVSFKSKAAAQAYAIADNKAGEMSEWNDSILFDLMGSPEMKDQQPFTGFEQNEINQLMMEPDENKLYRDEDSALSTIRVICKPEDRQKVFQYIERIATKKFKSVVVK